MYSLNCNGRLLDLSTPKVMGILNITPDSFFDGSQYDSVEQALLQTQNMLDDGADIIDIGGMSSRPGADIITVSEELKRVLPVVEQIKKQFPNAILSIDTIRSEVAKQTIAAGAHIINDISAGQFDKQLYETVAELQVPYMLMHMKGTPKTMQQNPTHHNIVQHVIDFFVEQVHHLKTLGVKDIVIDPGFGFGKSIQANYQLLYHLRDFKIFDLPILTGVSRKSMIYKVLENTPQEALNGSTVLHTIALNNGANLLRVHDVKEAKEVIKLWSIYQSSNDK